MGQETYVTILVAAAPHPHLSNLQPHHFRW